MHFSKFTASIFPSHYHFHIQLPKHQKRLRSLAENLVITGECESVSDLVVLHPLNSLLTSSLADINSLNPRFDVLLASKLKHGNHLGSVTDVGCTNVATVGSEVLQHQADRVIWHTDVVELAHNLQGTEVVGELELMGHVRGVEDEIEGECVVLCPIFLVVDDEVLCAHLQCVLLLRWRVGNDVDFSSEGRGPKDCEMS